MPLSDNASTFPARRRYVAGRRRSSEDDLRLRLHGAPDRWRWTGSESVTGRAQTRPAEYDHPRLLPSQTNCNRKTGCSSSAPSQTIRCSLRWTADFVAGGRAFACELASDARRVADAQLGHLAHRLRQRRRARARGSPAAAAAAALLVRTRFAWSAFASRLALGARRTDDRRARRRRAQRRSHPRAPARPRSSRSPSRRRRRTTALEHLQVEPSSATVSKRRNSRARRGRSCAISRCGERGPRATRPRGSRRAGRRRGSTPRRRPAAAAARAERAVGEQDPGRSSAPASRPSTCSW